MKNILEWIGIGFLFCLLILSFYVSWKIDTNRATEIKELKTELLNTKKYHRYGIFVGDTTIHYTTNLKIDHKDYKYLHVKRLKKGKNQYYFVLKENVGITLIVNKY